MNEPRYDCAIDAAMSVIEGRWKTVILCNLAYKGSMRFNQLLKSIDGISSRILTKQLKELEEDGVVLRKVTSEPVLKVEYSLSPKGESLIPVMKTIAEWGLKNMFPNMVKIEGAESLS